MLDRIIKANGEVIETSPKNGTDYSLEELHDVVNGYIEIVSSKDDREVMVVNEEGKLEGLPLNPKATYWHETHTNLPFDYIVGDVLICDKKHIK
jgi:hypothetical protein